MNIVEVVSDLLWSSECQQFAKYGKMEEIIAKTTSFSKSINYRSLSKLSKYEES